MPFTESHPENPLLHTQPTTYHILLPSLLALAPSLIHLTYGVYQVALAATQVTMYLYSRLYPSYGSSPGFSHVSSRAQGLRIYSKPPNLYSLFLLTTVFSLASGR